MPQILYKLINVSLSPLILLLSVHSGTFYFGKCGLGGGGVK